MKNKVILPLIIILPLISCERISDLFDARVDQIKYGDCKTNLKKSENSERIEYKTVDRKYLQIKHINVLFNCEPGKLLVDVDQVNDTIFVDENEKQSIANCICPYDLFYRIGPIDYGDYFIKFQRDGLLFAELIVNFNSTTSGIYEINR
jgi:hypothetical protein